MIGIYMFEHKISKKKYIGQSINITKRKWEHLHCPSPYSKIDDALHTEGEQQFNFVILEQCNAEQLDEREEYWINFYNTINSGYNLITGGNCYRGENNIQSKLTELQVLEIIKLLEQGLLNNKQIAERYMISQGTIDLINRCKIWTYLHHYNANIRNENLQLYGRTSHCGEMGTNKINELQAKEVINLLINDNRSMAQLARDLNISIYIINDINRCKTWRYLHSYNSNIRKEARKVVMNI